MIGIVDYNAGNIKSVERALASLQIEYFRSNKIEELSKADRLIFPGVGDAAYSMEQLNSSGLADFLRDWANNKKPLLGICLGSQIIFDFSEEGDTKCLGIIPGKIEHIKKHLPENSLLKIPHMGYNNLTFQNGGCKLFEGVKENPDFYFVHSYMIVPEDKTVIKATAGYGTEIPACIQKDNVFAFQFHPEKSGEEGLKLLKNFCQGEL